MEYYNELVKILETKDFSIELIDDCKDIFQIGGWDLNDFNRFSKLFYKKAKASCPVLTDEQIEQISKVIYWRGGLKLEDILFIDGAAFASYGHTDIWENGKYTSAYAVNFYGPSKKYKQTDFLETTHFFYYHLCVSQKLNENVASILPQLRDEMNDIFVNYYNNKWFPKKLASDSAHACNYLISCNEDEIINGLNNKIPFNTSILCKVEDELRFIKLDINCNFNNEKFLTITNIDDTVEKLSTIIDQNKCNEESNGKRIRLTKTKINQNKD